MLSHKQQSTNDDPESWRNYVSTHIRAFCPQLQAWNCVQQTVCGIRATLAQCHMDMNVTDSYPLLDAAEGATETPTVALVPQGVVQAEHIDGAGTTAANTSNIACSSHGVPMSEAAQDTPTLQPTSSEAATPPRGKRARLTFMSGGASPKAKGSPFASQRCTLEQAIAQRGLRVLPRRGPRRLLQGLP